MTLAALKIKSEEAIKNYIATLNQFPINRDSIKAALAESDIASENYNAKLDEEVSQRILELKN